MLHPNPTTSPYPYTIPANAAQDAAENGNTASNSIDIIHDATPPTFAVKGNSTDFTTVVELDTGTYEVGTIDNVQDANPNPANNTVTGNDAVDINSVGPYPVNYTVTDAAGNSKTIQETVNVTDTTLPTFTVDGNSDDFTTNVELVDGRLYAWNH